jgi:hypothetical protein
MRSALLSLILIATFIGCGKPKTLATTTKNPTQPEWVDNSEQAGFITAVGVAAPNPLGDISFQRTQASNRAFAALAVKVQANVEAMFAEATANNVTGNGKKVNAAANQESLQVIRNLVSVQLKGIQVPHYWRDQQTGNVFALARISEETTKQMVRSYLKDQPLLHDSLKQLDIELDKRKSVTQQ